MRLRVRWPGATLRPAMLWPELRLGLSTGSPPILLDSSSPVTPEEQAQAGTEGLPRTSSGDILPTPLIQQKVTGDVGFHGSALPPEDFSIPGWATLLTQH